MGSKEFMPGFGGYYTASLYPQLVGCTGQKPPPKFSAGQKTAAFSETRPKPVIPAQANPLAAGLAVRTPRMKCPLGGAYIAACASRIPC
jgi:hypothetical protein